MKKKGCMRIVVKVGTSTITHSNGQVNIRNIEKLVRVLADLKGIGHEIILVTSGAIAVGASKLTPGEKPKELRFKQAAASVGQCRLMHMYDKLFGEYNHAVGQILLTDEDVENEIRRNHLEATFEALFEMNVVPIVNENDSVSSAEIETGARKKLGDNDTLSAIVAKLCKADLLILMSDIDGLYDSDPRTNPNAKLIRTVDNLTENIIKMAGGVGSTRGTGGMVTKLNAASIAMNSGFDMVITNGVKTDKIYDIVEGKKVGTRFIGKKTK